MGRPVSHIGHHHVCPLCDPKPHVGGPVTTGQTSVRINGIPIATVGDLTVCTGLPGPDPIASGSAVLKINGRKVARLGDLTQHGGSLVAGAPSVRAD